MTKKIGIVGTMVGDVFGVPSAYINFAAKFGHPLIITPEPNQLPDVDLLIMRGGADVTPALQGHMSYNINLSNPYLDAFHFHKLSHYVNNKTPIFGICRGMQELNLFFGGTLEHHLPYHITSDYRNELVHKVTNLDKIEFKVNSMHHQAIDELGKNIKPILWASNKKGDKIHHIEAIKHEKLPIVGVQWHPEEILDKFSINNIKHLLL